ncbi:alpha/beta fold hydrolase [Chroogloeocystis siderophila]|jgi:pimeloyl-ACP methyl ester carboxylesterase|uniref:Lysophospholipase n=1 Tax=Chroogloeocystis siderophila 5.2 s.c.1 TaxID=247279 RepID=A0A1U7HK58_9CHRO|nr:alpha/beta hydrolase [Chroogloeocystis siderophila]OKH23957.1 lysophospholipase [Chroogloeocystis siderophila 5.2 s.c.1]
MPIDKPDFILYAQHGWADTGRAITSLANRLATPKTLVVSPNLGFINTWLRIEPLIAAVEKIAIETNLRYPNMPIRIIGHSMGGLIWLEVLNRHPEWWSRVESLVLIASPVGGADLARLLDPLSLGVGIARDLGKNRREIAEAIAKAIPTLIIAGDFDNGSDGTIPISSTKFRNAQFVLLPGLSHAIMRHHSDVTIVIQDFWASEKTLSDISEPELTDLLIQRLQLVSGITDTHHRDFSKAQVCFTLESGISICTWKNLLGIDHVFVSCPEGKCLYSGFVGWLHSENLHQTLQEIEREFTENIS